MFHVFNRSREYNHLSSQLIVLAEQLGFRYLNSDHCIQLMHRRHFLEEEILRSANNDKLIQVYKDWLDIIDLRENEMIKNIYNYSERNTYKSAVFLIGVEHRQPIIHK